MVVFKFRIFDLQVYNIDKQIAWVQMPPPLKKKVRVLGGLEEEELEFCLLKHATCIYSNPK